jgi:hypothetical protein
MDAHTLAPCTTQDGHDLVIGGHLRPDKASTAEVASASAVAFLKRRQRLVRGCGNVWQHLRSFRKGLFDRIADTDLRRLDPFDGVSQPSITFSLNMHHMNARCTRVQKCMHTYTHTYTHVHIFTHMHTYRCSMLQTGCAPGVM